MKVRDDIDAHVQTCMYAFTRLHTKADHALVLRNVSKQNKFIQNVYVFSTSWKSLRIVHLCTTARISLDRLFLHVKQNVDLIFITTNGKPNGFQMDSCALCIRSAPGNIKKLFSFGIVEISTLTKTIVSNQR